MAAQRYMMILEAKGFLYVNHETNELTNSEDPKAIEFIHFFLKGQSFLYNQIRKMIGVMIQVFRGGLDDNFLPNTLRDNVVNVALAPGDGLLLERVCYDKYNANKKDKKNDIMIKTVLQTEEVKEFREMIIRHIAKRETEEKAFTKWLTQFDDYCEDFYVQRPQYAVERKDGTFEEQNQIN